MKKVFLGLIGIAVFTVCVYGQDANSPHVVKMATTKFMTLPMLPACLQLAAQEGDPMKEAASLLLKMSAGCSVPWHWHTANERLYIVSGKGKAEMKDHGAEAVGAGDYVYLAGKGVHQFTCSTACVFFNVTDGAFDIHYVKPDGSEITPEEALKAKKAAPVKAKAK
jgi:quercetin dioxygenase-like cupin family protein